MGSGGILSARKMSTFKGKSEKNYLDPVLEQIDQKSAEGHSNQFSDRNMSRVSQYRRHLSKGSDEELDSIADIVRSSTDSSNYPMELQ